MTPTELIKKGSNFLKQNNIRSHIIDAELILSSVHGKSRENLAKIPGKSRENPKKIPRKS